MLNINKIKQDDVIIFELEGRLDTVSAPALQDAVDEEIGDAAAVVFDFKKLEYLSVDGGQIRDLSLLADIRKHVPDIVLAGGVDVIGIHIVEHIELG